MAGQVLQFLFSLDVAMNNKFSQPMRALSGDMQKLSAMSRKMQERAGDITAFQKLGESVKVSSTRLEYLRASIRSNSESLTSSRARTASLSEQYEAAKKRASDWSKTMPKNSMQLMFAKRRADELGRQMRESAQETARLEREQSKLYRASSLAEQRLSGETAQLEAMRNALREAGVNTDNLASQQGKLESAMKRVSNAQAKLDSIRQTLGWGNIKQTIMGAYPVVNAVKAPVKLAADFEAAMAKVKAVGFTDGTNLEGLAKMRQQALKLGAETKFTSVEAARAQEQLIRGGMTPEQTMQAMEGTLNMAAAEGMSIDEAANIIAKGLGGMQLEANLAPRYADVLAYTSSKSNTDIRNISEAMKIAAPVASKQGIQLEKLASYIGVFANKGYEASVVGNALSSSISRLARRPKQADAALNELGVSVQTVSGRLVELPDIMMQISRAFKEKNIGELQQAGYLSNIFGAEYGKQMTAFMSAVESGEQERMQTGEYVESFGWSGKQADINLDTLNGQLDILASAWDGVKISVGEVFSPVVRAGVEMLSAGLSRLNVIMLNNPLLTKTVLFTTAGVALSKTAAALVNIGGALVRLPFAKIALWSAENAAAMAGGTAQIGAFSRAISLMAHPINAIKTAFISLGGVIMAHPLIAIGTLVAAGIAYALSKCEWFRKWWDSWTVPDIFAALGDYAANAIGTLKGLWQSFTDWWDSWTVPDIFAALGDYAANAITTLKGLWQSFADWISSLNPFSSWSAPAPETVNVGGASHSTGGSRQASNAFNALSGYQPPSIAAHATGGILTTPHIGLVAEAGPEAIIPLNDKTRGIPLLMQAMDIMGLYMPDTASYPAIPSSTKQASLLGAPQNSPFMAGASSPVNVNLTVNFSGTDSSGEQNIAARIKQAVIDALEELSGLQERVSYA